MSDQRIRRMIRSVRDVTYEKRGEGHTAGFILEAGKWEEYDPFLIMAEDWFERGTFPPHPHRGIETVTYVIDGKLEHTDNQSGTSVLEPGDVQWMTAGSGIIHSEEAVKGETVHTLQLWVNLPSDHKMTKPHYQNLRREQMPVRQEEGAKIRVFSGSSKGAQATTKNIVPVTMVELTLEAGTSIAQQLPARYNGFIYIIEGIGTFGAEKTEGKKGQVLWMDRPNEDCGEETIIEFHAKEKLRVILYAGEPIGEKIVARGPFVMNSEEEIRQAYLDYQSGKFS